MLNSVGLQNPGVDAFIRDELPFLRQFDVKVIANISGNTPEEYGVMCEKLSEAGVDMIEVNISCPNVKAGGLAYGTRPDLAAEVTAEAKRHARVPVMVKLSPNVTDITEIAKAAADAIGAKVVIPMHYRKGTVGFDVLGTVEDFTGLYPEEQVKAYPSNTLTLAKDTPRQVAVLSLAK